MTAALEFIVPGPPVPKQRARQGKGGHWYTPPETRAFEQGVGVAAMVARIRERWAKADAVSTFAVDNCAKSVLDGINGVLWRDDRQVARLVVNRRVDRERPHTRVVVTPLEQMPRKGGAR